MATPSDLSPTIAPPTPSTRQPALAVENLRVETTSGADVVAEINFTVGMGEVVALVGESGCGKTSTALALLGHARPGTRIAAGTVRLNGRDILRLPQPAQRRLRGSEISYVTQDPAASLNPRQRVGDQIAEVLRVHRATAASAATTVRDLARRVGLPTEDDFLRRYPFELSGGQQQRVAIAMALVCKPLVVVLDEPTTGLDVTTQARILDLLRELSAASGAAFVYVTHDLAVVDVIADRVAVMYAGRTVETGSRERVFRRPAHPYTASLLGSVPRLSVRQHLVGMAGTAPPPGHRPSGCFFAPRCSLAVERCRQEFPPVTEVDSGHTVRCWRASEAAIRGPMAVGSAGDAAVPDRAALLTVENLVASYGRGQRVRRVLHGISLSVSPGECLAVVGESGSGKSTLGRCIVGLHRPDAGLIALNGSPLAPFATERVRSERQAIGLVFQNPDRSLNPRETIGDAIARPLRLFGLVERSGERRQVVGLLERVRLPGSALDRYPRELSGGEKQRVAIARALAGRPALLICDEITSSLDVSIQAAIVALLGELQQGGLTLLFITHNLALVNSIADRVLVLEGGEVRETGEIATVIGRPAHPYTRQLLAAAPDLIVPT